MRLLLFSGVLLFLTASFIKPHPNFEGDTTLIDTLNSPKIHLFFIVEKNGKLSNIKGKIIRCNGCDKAYKKQLLDSVILILKKSKKWTVGMKNGKPVRVHYTLPIVLVTDSTTTRDSIFQHSIEKE